MKRVFAWSLALLLGASACDKSAKKGTTPTDPKKGDTSGEVKKDEPKKDPGTPGKEGGVEMIVAKGKPSNDLIPREVFFGNPERAGVQISPDGKHLSWLAENGGVLNIWVAPISDLAAAKAITSDTSRPVRNYFWSFDNKNVLYLQDKGGNENFRLYRVDIATGTTTDLTPLDNVRVVLFGVSPKSPNKLIVGLNDRDPRYHDPYEVDLSTGERKKLLDNTEEFASFVFDDDLKLRFAVKSTDDGGSIYFEQEKGAWTKKILEVSADDGLTTDILSFNKKGTSVYLLDSRERDTGALFEMDLKTGKKKLLFEDARADVGNVFIHPTEKTAQAVAVEYDRERWTVLDKKVKGDFDALAKVADGDFGITARTLDDKTWIVAFSGDNKSTQYYQWDRSKKAATLLFTSRPALDKLPLVKMHPVIIKSRDGLDLVSYLTLPSAADTNADGKPESASPMVLLVHGGPWARDAWGFNPYHQLLANRGYAVLSVNFRGSTGFGKKFINAANGQWGKKMHDDLLDAVDWAVAGGVAPKDKVCIMGGSYGGYATLTGLTLTPDVFACGVDIVGPSSIVTLLNTIPPYWASGLAMFKTRVGDWTTEEGKKALDAVSPLSHVEKIKKPLLIGQGANDPRVKQSESDQIVKAMQGKKIPVSYVLFPDEGHGFARPVNNIAFTAVAEAFLSAHLGGLYLPISKEDLSKSTIQIPAGKNGIPGLF